MYPLEYSVDQSNPAARSAGASQNPHSVTDIEPFGQIGEADLQGIGQWTRAGFAQAVTDPAYSGQV